LCCLGLAGNGAPGIFEVLARLILHSNVWIVRVADSCDPNLL
jgi:hypothetical protein